MEGGAGVSDAGHTIRHMDTILVTGGAGYIGTHTAVELIGAGFRPVVVDSLVNSSVESLARVKRITGTEVPLHRIDLLDESAVTRLLDEIRPKAVRGIGEGSCG